MIVMMLLFYSAHFIFRVGRYLVTKPDLISTGFVHFGIVGLSKNLILEQYFSRSFVWLTALNLHEMNVAVPKYDIKEKNIYQIGPAP